MDHDTGDKQTQPYTKLLKFFLIVIIILFAIFVLTPRYWEPGAESWKQWAAARILSDTEGFPVFSLGPLYIVYLQIFSLFTYPLSINLEYIITHLFTYLAIYFLLQKFIRSRYALLLIIAWIPLLATVESGGAVAGIGFVCLYLIQGKNILRNNSYFPPPLAAAALCYSNYIPFLAGHVIGTFIKRWQEGKPFIRGKPLLSSLKVFGQGIFGQGASLLINIGFIVLVLLTILSPSTRFDHNHVLMDTTYSPIPLNDPLTLCFFQTGNWNYVRRTVPQSQWIYQDWYFTNEKAYGNATTILQAVYNRPETVVRNLLMNVGIGIHLPLYFFSGIFIGPLSGPIVIIFWLLPLLAIFGLINRFKGRDYIPLIFSVGLGILAMFGTLLLTNFNKRYMVTLLPIALLMLCYTGLGFNHIIKRLVSLISKSNSLSATKSSIKEKKTKRFLLILGGIFIFIGIFANKWMVSSFLLPYKDLSSILRLQIWIFDIFFITLGSLLIIFRNCIITFLYKTMKTVEYKQRLRTLSSRRTAENFTKVLVVMNAVLILLTAQYPFGKTIDQIEAIYENKGFLSEAYPISMADAHQELLKSIHENTKVLALENYWIIAFTNVPLDNIYSLWSLPPFADSSGEIEKKLGNLDVIWVSPDLTREEAGIGTQSYLRYLLHIKPFLEQGSAEKWTVQTVEHYGEIYQKVHV